MPLKVFEFDELDPARAIQKQRFEPHPYVTFIPKPSWQTAPDRQYAASHNSLGFRGPESTWQKPAGRFRVLCLGGSSTYGYTTTNDESTYPFRLQAHLRLARPGLDVEVINCGLPGYTSFESMANLASRALAFEPDLVIVYHGLNDAHAALYRSWLHPEARAKVDNTHYRSNWRVTSKGSLESWLEHSRGFLVLRRYLTDYASQQRQLNSALVVDSDPNQKNAFDNPAPSPQGFLNFERNLVSIIGIARVHGAEVVLATQALDEEDFANMPGQSGAIQMAACRRIAESLRRVANERSAVYLADIAPRLESIATERKQLGMDDVFTDTVHFTNHGTDLLAQLMAQELLASGFLPKQSE